MILVIFGDFWLILDVIIVVFKRFLVIAIDLGDFNDFSDFL